MIPTKKLWCSFFLVMKMRLTEEITQCPTAKE